MDQMLCQMMLVYSKILLRLLTITIYSRCIPIHLNINKSSFISVVQKVELFFILVEITYSQINIFKLFICLLGHENLRFGVSNNQNII